jgi:hypothetical protein
VTPRNEPSRGEAAATPVAFEIRPSLVVHGGMSPRVMLLAALGILVSVAGFALLGETATTPFPSPSAQVALTPLAAPVVPLTWPSETSPLPPPGVLLGVSATEAWGASVDTGLWHVHDGATTVPIAGPHPAGQIWDLARMADGTLAVATDEGVALLRKGHWTMLTGTAARSVAFAPNGAIWVAAGANWRFTGDSGTFQTTLASFRLDGRAPERSALFSLTTAGPPHLALGLDGAAWIGAGGERGSLDRFDGSRWESESPLGEPGVWADPIQDVAVAPSGDVWVALDVPDHEGDRSWALARYDGTSWTVYRPADGLANPGRLLGPGDLTIAPAGSIWVTTDQGLVRFDGDQWSRPLGGSDVRAISFAPDGTLWALGPTGPEPLPAAQLGRSTATQ